MKYVSTRGSGGTSRVYTFEESVLSGWADDGGMLVPESIPHISRQMLTKWANQKPSFQTLCFEIFSRFISEEEIPQQELKHIIDKAFDRFALPGVVHLVPDVRIANTTTLPKLSILELWHGPTCAFKDLGLQMLGSVLDYLLERRNDYLHLVVGTSGDTGPAAIEAVKGKHNLEIICLYPSGGRVSKIQENQMTSVTDTNVHVIGVDGTSDDLDAPMEVVFRDTPFKKRHKMGSVNSVNIVRILCHTVNFFYGVIHSASHPTQGFGIPGVLGVSEVSEVSPDCAMVVPTGAAGHLTGGIIAKMMGLPMHSICASVNQNDVMHRFLSTGVFCTAATYQTVAPAMDIQVPYNIERIFYFATNGDSATVTKWMAMAKEGSEINMKLEAPLAFAKITDVWGIWSHCASDAEIISTIKDTNTLCGYIPDPHTAVGLSALKFGNRSKVVGANRVVAMGCAHPVKFMELFSRIFVTKNIEDTIKSIPQTMTHPHVSNAARLVSQEHTSIVLECKDVETHLRKLIESLSRRRIYGEVVKSNL